ncbi:leucine-rich repeat domain-containing protein [Pseudoduganella violaceinigra]|uniref:leucine-rich repeat domain-containing protein n=1 Tax=Pseudoduganella violaceinigra TaxID=246602 RepID=UPI0003F54D4C|nr:leucine-rich repeat domain-containing protein [Pseudoduganella violaceinigra]
MHAKLKDKILALQRQLELPYPEVVMEPLDEALDYSLTNFLRNGPHRKVIVLNLAGGDYQYDEDMTPDVEYAMEAECDAIYKEALVIAEGLFGKSRKGWPKDGDSYYEPDSDDFPDKEDEEFDGVPWSQEYEGGAVHSEAETMCYWDVNGQYVFLQKGRWTGDDNFQLFALMTATPKLGTSAMDEDDELEEADCEPGKPQEIAVIENAIGDTLKEKKIDEVMDWFARNTYSVDENGNVTGLNIRKNQLTNLDLLKGLDHLENLNVSENAISDISLLSEFRHLRELSIGSNRIENIDVVANLPKLISLNVNDNKIRAFEALRNLNELRHLYAHCNAIADIEPLRHLTALVELGIGGNGLSDIAALKDLVNLELLKVYDNKIQDLGVLTQLENLNYLQIEKNPAVKKLKLKLEKYGNHLEDFRAALK